MPSLDLQSRLKLRDGNEIPILGFGTYELDGRDAYNAVKWALEAGYRHIDSAEWYENERECGQAILDFCKDTSTPRSTIFYTTKLKSNSGYEATKRAIERSLKACGLGYMDLYLMHSPIGGPQAREEAWKAICEAQSEGKLKSAGVSCFGVRHLKEMVGSGVPVPTVNQIDLHPFMTRSDIVTYCEQHSIALEAWAPLVRGLRFKHPDIVKLAEKHGKQPAQILLRWSGFVAIPKSASKDRIVSNANIFDFELSAEEITALDGLDEYLVTDWDPTSTP
ncbi:Aldo/keto reductase [Heliocybe sulcata]|uniref:Aldo/keto reductase n=1 Tax=Heliocybe sulcata TaxID=5364 RepID=A0A5C3N2A3_9AGAM|nr:Aldo/keto reductase [Heliocybe sulcata]